MDSAPEKGFGPKSKILSAQRLFLTLWPQKDYLDHYMDFKSKLVLYLFVFCSFNNFINEQSVQAVIFKNGSRVYVGNESALNSKILALAWPAYSGVSRENFTSSFPASSTILLLGEGSYAEIKEDLLNTSNRKSLTQELMTLVPESTLIYSTDIRNDKTVIKDKNIIYEYLNHNKVFPYKSDQFDTIIMRKGICHCDGFSTNCGGIDLMVRNTFTRFISEVTRVLNKENKNALALLNGVFIDRDLELESKVQIRHEQELPEARLRYPDQDFRSLYVLKSAAQDKIDVIEQQVNQLQSTVDRSPPEESIVILSQIEQLKNDSLALEKDLQSYKYFGVLVTNKNADRDFLSP